MHNLPEACENGADLADQLTVHHVPSHLQETAWETFSALTPQDRDALMERESNREVASYISGLLQEGFWRNLRSETTLRAGVTLALASVAVVLLLAGVTLASPGATVIWGALGLSACALVATLVILGYPAASFYALKQHRAARRGRSIAEAVAAVDTTLGRTTRYVLEQGTLVERDAVADALKKGREKVMWEAAQARSKSAAGSLAQPFLKRPENSLKNLAQITGLIPQDPQDALPGDIP